ncbi:MAG TPA: phospholipase A [Burkholderiales bacterium]
MRAALLALLLACAGAAHALGPEWLLVSPDGKAEAGQRFDLMLVSPGEPFPDEVAVRIRIDLSEVLVTMRGEGPPQGLRRIYSGIMPDAATGTVPVQLAGRPSNTVLLEVLRRDDVQRVLAQPSLVEEAPLSEEDPVYFVVGPRGGWNARFQLSFKYRLFDPGSGFGAGRPWLSSFYFGYTQSSAWDLESTSKPFRDTSYRPSLFWKWERADEQTWIDAARLGVEHESNGRSGLDSRSINILFLRPEWRWRGGGGRLLELTPKVYTYLSKGENPDIARYRGHVDWRVRYDSGGQWIATAIARVSEAGRGSLLFDLSRRTRDVRVGPLSGYLHLQFFNGYGETIVDYNVRRKAQIRIGLAIVP